MAEAAVEAWHYEKLGVVSDFGTLRLNGDRLTFESEGRTLLDVSTADAEISFPALAFGALMNVKTGGHKYKFSFYDPMSRSAVAQMRGRGKGAPLRDALKG